MKLRVRTVDAVYAEYDGPVRDEQNGTLTPALSLPKGEGEDFAGGPPTPCSSVHWLMRHILELGVSSGRLLHVRDCLNQSRGYWRHPRLFQYPGFLPPSDGGEGWSEEVRLSWFPLPGPLPTCSSRGEEGDLATVLGDTSQLKTILEQSLRPATLPTDT